MEDISKSSSDCCGWGGGATCCEMRPLRRAEKCGRCEESGVVMAAGGVGCASSCSCWAGRGATSGEGGGSWCRAALGKKIWLRRKWAKMLELESDTVCVLFIRKCAKSGERRSIADDVMWSVAVAEKNSVDALRGKRRCARETGGKLDGQWGGGDSEDARGGWGNEARL